MTWHKEEEQFNCEHCGALCIYLHGKTIELRTKDKHKCAVLKKKIETGLIKVKGRTLANRLRDKSRPQFMIERVCGWCGAKWIYNELAPADERLYSCPQCEVPGSDFVHPVYGYPAMVQWAKENGKIIPKHLRKYL